MFTRIKTALLIGLTMLFASSVYASIPRNTFRPEQLLSSVQNVSEKTDHPSENRVWDFSELTPVRTGLFTVQAYGMPWVVQGTSYKTASGRYILSFIDPLGLNVYAIDGTWFDARITGDYSNVHDFYERAQDAGEFTRYYGGPGSQSSGLSRVWQGATGAGSGAISDRVYSNIRADLAAGNGNGIVNLVGWSRGGVIATEVAQRLGNDGVKVNFLGLYDAVEMNPFSSYPSSVPNNVQNFAHATKTGSTSLSQPFPTTIYNHANETSFGTYWGAPSSHGDIGAGNFSTDAHQWMLNSATSAGVKLGK